MNLFDVSADPDRALPDGWNDSVNASSLQQVYRFLTSTKCADIDIDIVFVQILEVEVTE